MSFKCILLLALLCCWPNHLCPSVGATNSLQDELNDDEFDQPAKSRTSDPDQHPLTKAIEIMEFVSTFSSTLKGIGGASDILSKISQNSSLTTTDPITLLTSVLVLGAIRLGSILLSTVVYLSSAVLTPLIGAQFDMDSINYYQLSDQSIDYSVISNSIRSVPEHSFRLLDIKEEECQSRAMCEGGQYVSKLFPSISNWVRMVAAKLDLKDRNTRAVLRGIGWSDCGSSFKGCPKSPFKKLHRIWSTFSRMY